MLARPIFVAILSVLALALESSGQSEKFPIDVVDEVNQFENVIDSMNQHKLSLLTGHLVGKLETPSMSCSYDVSWTAANAEFVPEFIGSSRMRMETFYKETKVRSVQDQITHDTKARLIDHLHSFCIDHPNPSVVYCKPGIKVIPHIHWYDLEQVYFLHEDEFRLKNRPGWKITVTEDANFVKFTRVGPSGAQTQVFYFSKHHGLLLDHYEIVNIRHDGVFPAGKWADGRFEWEQTEGVWWPKYIEQHRRFLNRATKTTRYERTIKVENKSFEPVDRTSPVTAADFAISKIPSGFLYTDRDMFSRIKKEMYTGEFGKLEYELKFRAAEIARDAEDAGK